MIDAGQRGVWPRCPQIATADDPSLHLPGEGGLTDAQHAEP